MPANTVLMCFCTCPDERSARVLAEALVGERLATCINQLPGVRSIYRWQGKVCSDHEVLLLIKTSAACFEALSARLLELHPYDLPELIAIPLELGHPAYLAWLRSGGE
ncbi:MAG: divalent-cation tolerance protein CutA [Rhodanobacter sp.]|nr:MAG: divalent-cation tolerance protein CutA [Rhodanobacter sp.]